MIENLIRENIKKLKPYTSARDIYSEGILLDANENSFGSTVQCSFSELNRYPDPHQLEMRKLIGDYLNTNYRNLFFGVGSDEIIDLLIRIFCVPGKDSILTAEPTYGMYKVSADINDIATNTISLNSSFDIEESTFFTALLKNPKLVFLCSPNNPTGNLLNKEAVISLLRKEDSIFVLDEAYIDFAGEENSLKTLVNDYPNLVILRTFSKAWGLAGIRLGYCIANEVIINYLFKVKAPYNLNSLTRDAFTKALFNRDKKDSFVKQILKERELLEAELLKIREIRTVYPSVTNYILIRINDAQEIQKALAVKGIIIRDRSTQINLDNCLRITIGTPEENIKLLTELKNVINERDLK